MSEYAIQCGHCNRPVFKLRDGDQTIIVRVRHGSEHHETEIPLSALTQFAADTMDAYDVIRAQR